jgi:hypothetical protein
VNIRALIKLLNQIAGALSGWMERQRQEARQRRHNEIEDDPAEFFDDHFPDGMLDELHKADKAEPERD